MMSDNNSTAKSLADLQARAHHLLGQLSQRYPSTKTSSKSLERAFSLSDFIANTCLQIPGLSNYLIQQVDGQVFTPDYRALLSSQLQEVSEETQLYRVIRQFRHKHMAAIAWQDLLGQQPIVSSLKQTSELANELIYQTYQWLYQKACCDLGTPMSNGQAMPMLIVAMGKLGGMELNFSSDIDLIFVYPEKGAIQGQRKPLEHQQFFTRLAQNLIQALSNLTKDGRVFRVDMRLRPMGDSGPLVTHINAFEDYYQEQGREWERYAMVKARILGPTNVYQQRLSAILSPYVYRKYVDFSAIESLRQMKLLISQEVKRRQLKRNIKLGSGGIREIEFIVQCFQLIRGGKVPQLQQQNLLSTLHTLIELELIERDHGLALQQAYLYLRKVEQHLQQFNDEQTQTLPEDDLSLTRLVLAMGYYNQNQLLAQLAQHQSVVSHLFALVIKPGAIEECQSKITYTTNQAIRNKEQTDSLVAHLSSDAISEYQHIIEQTTESALNKAGPRGKQALNRLLPNLISQVINHQSTDLITLLTRVSKVIQSVAGRTAYLDLINENQGVAKRLVHLCHASEWICEQLSMYPLLLDELIDPEQLYGMPSQDDYKTQLRQIMLRIEPGDLEQQMEALREFKLTHQLKIAAADITGVLPVMQVSDQLTFLAETIIREVVQLAWQQIAGKFGEPEHASAQNKGFAVVGYGKLGGLEMGYGSDLDLVFLHQSAPQTMTIGDKPVDARRFYIKLAQRIMHIFSTNTRSGVLYEIDLRLRPAGGAGLLVSHVNGFADYQQHDAWTWEHQALVRARVIDGSKELTNTFVQIREQILRAARDQTILAKDVLAMRTKMRTHLSVGNQRHFDLKQDTGGIADIEFLVQYWVLANANQFPDLCNWSDNVRILVALQRQGIIDNTQLKVLTQAYLAYRNAGHRLTLDMQQVVEKSSRFDAIRSQVSDIWAKTLPPNRTESHKG